MVALIFAKKVTIVTLIAALALSGKVFAEANRDFKSHFYNDTSSSLIKIFPSNSKNYKKTCLTFTVANPSKVSIKIYDVEGREIAYLMDKDVPAGTFELYLETKNLRKGVYYCKFFTGEKVTMKKMITISQ